MTITQPLSYETAIDSLTPTGAVSLAVSLAELALPVWLASHPDDDRPGAAIRAARAWLSCPCAEHREAAENAATAAYASAAASATAYATAAAYAAEHAAYAADDRLTALAAEHAAAYAAAYAAADAAALAAAYAATALGDARPVWRTVLEGTTRLTGAELDVATTLATDGWHGTLDELADAARLLEVAV